MADLWQWILMAKGVGQQSFLSQSDADELSIDRLGSVARFGAPVFAPNLVYPLVLGVAPQDAQLLQTPLSKLPGFKSAVDEQWLFSFVLNRGDEKKEPLIEKGELPLHQLSLCTELAATLVDGIDAVGLSFEWFLPSTKQSHFDLAFLVPSFQVFGELARSLELFWAIAELAAHSRGLALAEAELKFGSRRLSLSEGLAFPLYETLQKI